MDIEPERVERLAAYLLFSSVITQGAYTALYVTAPDISRDVIWGLEGVLFAGLAAIAGAAMVQAKNHQLAWSAIAFGAVLNVVQVSVGLTMFSTFGQAALQVEGLAPVTAAVVAFSFMIYNAAKILLGFAALTFGVSRMHAGGKIMGILTASVGVLAVVANIVLVVFGRDSFLPSAVAGASGVGATLLLSLCLLSRSTNE